VKRTSFTACAVTLFGLLMFGNNTVAQAATDHVTLGLGPTYPTYAIFAAAKELGYYAEQNLDVDIQSYRGSAAQDALAAGQVDLCSVVPMDAARAIAGGVREHIVAMYEPPRASGWFIMVAASSPIVTVADLNGQNIGVPRLGSPADFWVQQVAKNNRITMVSVPLAADVAAELIAKRVDAAVVWPPVSYKGLFSGDLRAIVDLDAALPPAISEGIAASGDMISKRPDVLRRWLSATSNAVRYMQNNEGWSEDFLKRYLGDDDDQTIDMVYRNLILKIDRGGAMHQDWMKNSLALGPAPSGKPGAKNLPPATGTVFMTSIPVITVKRTR
jgi:NitT/TauT family transport system substrate-binding protein